MKLTLKKTDVLLNSLEQKHIDRDVAKIRRLVARYGPATTLDIEVGRLTRHHRKGMIYRAEFNLVLPKTILRAEASAEDVLRAVETCRKELEREIDRYKTSKEEKNYRQARRYKRLKRMSALAWRGKGREDEQAAELYEFP